MDTLPREVTLIGKYLFPSNRGLLLKERTCSQREQILSFKSNPHGSWITLKKEVNAFLVKFFPFKNWQPNHGGISTELQIRGGIEDDSKMSFLISQQKHML